MSSVAALPRRAAWCAAMLMLGCESPPERAQRLLMRGDAAMARGDVNEAERFYGGALTAQPDMPEAAAGRGRVWLARGAPLEARQQVAACDVSACRSVRDDALTALKARLMAAGMSSQAAVLLATGTSDIGERSGWCAMLEAFGEMAALKAAGREVTTLLPAVRAVLDAAEVAYERNDESMLAGLEAAEVSGREAADKVKTCDDVTRYALLFEVTMRSSMIDSLGRAQLDDPASDLMRRRRRLFMHALLSALYDKLAQAT